MKTEVGEDLTYRIAVFVDEPSGAGARVAVQAICAGSPMLTRNRSAEIAFAVTVSPAPASHAKTRVAVVRICAGSVLARLGQTLIYVLCAVLAGVSSGAFARVITG